MAKTDPEQCDFLAVVSEWTSFTGRGGQVGNAYPIVNLMNGQVVADPQAEFANAGAVFLISRIGLRTWDFVVLRPQMNRQYANAGDRDCYYIPARQPMPLTEADTVAVILDHPAFDPGASPRPLQNPKHNVTPVFFVQKGHLIFGPLLRDASDLTPMEDVQRIVWRPANDAGLFYEFTVDELAQKGLKIADYVHKEPWLNRVLATPIKVATGQVRKATSSRPRDALTDTALVEWYLARCPTADVPAEHLAALKAAFKERPGDDPFIVEARLRKINREMATADAFQKQRERFARDYVETDEGRQRVAELTESAVAKRAAEMQGEVDRQQAHLAARRDQLDRELADAEHAHRTRMESIDRERDEADRQVTGLRAAAEELQASLMFDAKQLAAKVHEQLPLLAALSPRGEAVAVSSSSSTAMPTRRVPEFRPILPTAAVQPITGEARLVAELHADLARQKLHFAKDFVANAYACLKAEPLNLIIGPPGYGKSSLVAGLATALGHADALLRIAVRRSWAEDRHLLGFYDTFHGRYDPGPTGLVPRLLQAAADWKQDRAGVYLVLLDEFNLAAPEYYFSQLLQALPGDEATRGVQLYDGAAAADAAFPPRVPLTPNVRFWGTINYDETTERLSPRTLDRTGMIFLGDGDVPAASDVEPPAAKAVSAGDLFATHTRAADDCPEESWDLVAKAIDVLRSGDAALGPRVELSPRVRTGVKRYLANARDVLSPRSAADFAVQQRILPVVRGRGDDFTVRIRRLLQTLAESGLSRSAAHVEGVLLRAEQHFGDLDFLGY